jgi:hypothetical protein
MKNKADSVMRYQTCCQIASFGFLGVLFAFGFTNLLAAICFAPSIQQSLRNCSSHLTTHCYMTHSGWGLTPINASCSFQSETTEPLWLTLPDSIVSLFYFPWVGLFLFNRTRSHIQGHPCIHMFSNAQLFGVELLLGLNLLFIFLGSIFFFSFLISYFGIKYPHPSTTSRRSKF